MFNIHKYVQNQKWCLSATFWTLLNVRGLDVLGQFSI